MTTKMKIAAHVLAVLLSTNSQAQDGSLDLSFDNDGKVTTAIGVGADAAKAMGIQSDGKILLAGLSSNGGFSDFALVRYNSDGSLDLTFDTDGKVTTDIGSEDDYASAMMLQPDGKILLAGLSWNGTNFDFALVRYIVMEV